MNPDEVREGLRSAARHEPLYIDAGAEGGSLTALGIADLLRNYCEEHDRDPKSIHVINFPNSAENLEFSMQPFLRSHFFGMSKNYWCDDVPICNKSAALFGLFLGRMTVSRAAILRDCMQYLGKHFLFSKMSSSAAVTTSDRAVINLDQTHDWTGVVGNIDIDTWWNNVDVVSIDRASIRDQYDPGKNTNRSLLDHYSKFRIELVVETFTRGTTFFPTEKTIRPLVGCKPMLIYGPRHFLKNLRDMGFCTWSDIWDESYDDHEGPNRWQIIKRVLSDVIKAWHDNSDEFDRRMLSISHHNRNVLGKINGLPC